MEKIKLGISTIFSGNRRSCGGGDRKRDGEAATWLAFQADAPSQRGGPRRTWHSGNVSYPRPNRLGIVYKQDFMTGIFNHSQS
jgi:hypothetical protein